MKTHRVLVALRYEALDNMRWGYRWLTGLRAGEPGFSADASKAHYYTPERAITLLKTLKVPGYNLQVYFRLPEGFSPDRTCSGYDRVSNISEGRAVVRQPWMNTIGWTRVVVRFVGGFFSDPSKEDRAERLYAKGEKALAALRNQRPILNPNGPYPLGGVDPETLQRIDPVTRNQITK